MDLWIKIIVVGLSLLSQMILANGQQELYIRQQLSEQLQLIAIADKRLATYQQNNIQSNSLSLELLSETSGNDYSERLLPLPALVSQLSQYWQMNDINFNQGSWLNQASLLRPHHPYYQLIRERVMYLLQKHTELNNRQERWKKLKLNRVIKPGENHSALSLISQRLMMLGDLPGDINVEGYFSPPLQAAVIKFQQRHGLKPDGIIGQQTLAWLNMPLNERAKLLARNFIRQEEWFKLSGSSYLLVNIPDFELKLVHADIEVLSSRVTVGRRYRATRLIQSKVTSVVINPGWTVPSTILRKDILPKLQKNIHYLAEKELDIFDQNNERLVLDKFDKNRVMRGDFPYRVYQKPGPENPLGNFKLHFDNPYSIYLHDTPQKQQFEQLVRALSSGCVRVEEAPSIARWLAVNRGGNMQRWQRALEEDGTTYWLKLDAPLPVYIVYWTAWMGPQALPQYRQDIYGWERNFNLLAKQWRQKDKAVRNIASHVGS